MTADESELIVASALAEEVYRRSISLSNEPIGIEKIGARAIDLSTTLNNLGGHYTEFAVPNAGIVGEDVNQYYYSENGFVGSVTSKSTKIYVTMRGTDATGALSAAFKDAFRNGYLGDGTYQDPGHNTDFGDIKNNVLLGGGVAYRSQADSAYDLVRAAKVYAAANGFTEVVVVGQSLGGGLAALASAVENVRGIGIAPAPFVQQLFVEGMINAILTYADDHGLSSSISREIITSWPNGKVSVNQADQAWFLDPSVLSGILEDVGDGSLASFVDDIFSLGYLNFTVLQERLTQNFDSHAIGGEALNYNTWLSLYGAVQYATGYPIFVDIDHEYDVGYAQSWNTAGPNAAPTLHGASMHALVMASEFLGKGFQHLLASDSILRDALLELTPVAAPLAEGRSDPVQATSLAGNTFGVTSYLVTEGLSPGILWRTLWHSLVGLDEQGNFVARTGTFYDEFYERFGTWLNAGAVPAGANGVTGADSDLHAGFVKLGLGVVRTGVDDAQALGLPDSKAMNVFGSIKDGYLSVSLSDISKSATQVEHFVASDAGRVYGARDVDQAFMKALGAQMQIADHELETRGGDLFQGTDGVAYAKQVLSYNPSVGFGWNKVVAQAGPATAAGIRYEVSSGGSSAILFGGTGNDTFKGSQASDWISGGEGDDLVEGRSGADVIVGGDQHSYSSWYSYGWGWWSDEVGDLARPWGDVLTYASSTQGVSVDLERILLAQTGGDAEGDRVVGFESLIGSAHGDILKGDDGENYIDGGSDNDVLRGRGGVDALNGGAGNDDMDGGSGNDVLHGGDGDDTLVATDAGDTGAVDAMYGDAGDDVLIAVSLASATGYKVLMDGGIDDDTLVISGNAGSHFVSAYGGAGDDRFVFAHFDPASNNDTWGGSGSDTLMLTLADKNAFLADIPYAVYWMTQHSFESVETGWSFTSPYYSVTTNDVVQTYDIRQLMTDYLSTATPGGYNSQGPGWSDIYYTVADELDLVGSGRHLLFSADVDPYQLDIGSATHASGTGTIAYNSAIGTVYSPVSVEVVDDLVNVYVDGTMPFDYDDVAFINYLTGSLKLTYEFSEGVGYDTYTRDIYRSFTSYVIDGNDRSLQSIALDGSTSVDSNGYLSDLQLSAVGLDQTESVDWSVSGDNPFGLSVDRSGRLTSSAPIEFVGGQAVSATIVAYDGTSSISRVVTLNPYVPPVVTPPAGLTGTAGDDYLFGTNGRDVIRGLAGNDELQGFDGDDVLNGGPDFDFITGGRGDDTFEFGRGDGFDIVYEYETNSGSDRLKLGNGISYDQIWLERSGNDLLVSIVGTEDQVAIWDWYSNIDSQMDWIETQDGSIIVADDVDDLASAMSQFQAPAYGTTDIDPAIRSQLEPAFYAYWSHASS